MNWSQILPQIFQQKTTSTSALERNETQRQRLHRKKIAVNDDENENADEDTMDVLDLLLRGTERFERIAIVLTGQPPFEFEWN